MIANLFGGRRVEGIISRLLQVELTVCILSLVHSTFVTPLTTKWENDKPDACFISWFTIRDWYKKIFLFVPFEKRKYSCKENYLRSFRSVSNIFNKRPGSTFREGKFTYDSFFTWTHGVEIYRLSVFARPSNEVGTYLKRNIYVMPTCNPLQREM